MIFGKREGTLRLSDDPVGHDLGDVFRHGNKPCRAFAF